jgi:sporadic carbohydrate cluster 2OG-Fe(II) oxygenase/sporadic carbohydrate cluster protein (TIGR04323 family)
MYENFNGDTLDYSLERFNFPEWALARIQEKYPQVTDLETIHQTVPLKDISKLQSWVSAGCETAEFKELLDNFLVENIKPLIKKDFLIQRFGTLRVVIPQQEKTGRLLQPHQGIFVGNGTGLRTVWTPFTRAYDTNTMWMCNIDISREITRRVIHEKWSHDFYQNFSHKHSEPVTLVPGQSWLFNQEMMHGNVNNETDITRVSMDLRCMVKGENYGRKYPGQYFRHLFDWQNHSSNINTDESFITYVGWNSEYSKHLPMVIQRAYIDKYLVKNNIIINEYTQENEYLDHLPNLQALSTTVDNIIMLSIYSLPDEAEERKHIYNTVLDNNCALHFAQEDIVLNEEDVIPWIESYLTWGDSYINWNINT